MRALDEAAGNVSGQEDGAWIARVLEGDEEAARALVERLYPTIIRSVRCHLPRRTSEEDLVQAVFERIFKKLGQFSGRAPLEHWVSRITVNTCIKLHRQETARPELRLADLSEEENAAVQRRACTEGDSPGVQNHARHELLADVLARLNPEERLVVTLLHLEGRSTEEISRITGWPVSRVKVKAFRARHKMRRIWKALAA